MKKNRWGLGIILSAIFSLIVVLTLEQTIGQDWKGLTDINLNILLVFGSIISLFTILLGYFSYSKIHNLNIYLSGFLTGIIILIFYITQIFDLETRYYLYSFCLMMIFNLTTIPFFKSTVKFKTTYIYMIILVIIELFITIITLLSQSVDIFPALRSQDKLYISITILILALLSTLTIFILTRRKMKNHYYLGGTFVACSILVIFICRLFIQVPVTDLEIRYKPLLENEIETPGLRVISDDGERFESSISSGDRLFPFITGHSIGEIFDFKSDNINKPSIILDYNKAKTWRMFYIMLFQIYLLIGIVIYWFSKTENRVSYDPLLNIFNRQHSLKILNEQSKLNTSAPFAIAMVDIDFFKKVNDTYGHKAGDDVLVNVAQVLEQICGTDGVVCRYGGEEIVIFFPKKTRSEASKIIEVARKNIEQLQTKSGKKNISVTISTGISNRENNKQELNKVLQFADKALYSAKNSGRNKTKMVKTPVPKQEKQTQLISKKKNIKSKISKNGAAKNNKSKKS